jgi:hypothetical protein
MNDVGLTASFQRIVLALQRRKFNPHEPAVTQFISQSARPPNFHPAGGTRPGEKIFGSFGPI